MIKTLNHLCGLLGYTKDELLAIIDNSEKYYYKFSKVKTDGISGLPILKGGKIQKRNFTPSKKDLKHIQNKLQSKILGKIPLIPNILGGVKGNGNVGNAKIHKARKFRFQTDLTKFFPSVSDDMVYHALRSKGFSKQVANMISNLTTFRSDDSFRGKTLPQGAPTSPVLANIVFEKVDKQILNFIEGKDIYYTRWIDDLTFSSNQDFEDINLRILNYISKNGFKISREKTTYRTNSALVTGVVVGMSSLKVSDHFREKGKKPLNDLQKLGRGAYKDYIYKVDKTKGN